MKIIDREKIKNKIEEQTTMKFSLSKFDMGFHNNLFETEALDKKTIFKIERFVRNSYEYRSYIKYLKEELDLTRSALIPSMDVNTLPVALEFHHYPFTLFDLTTIIATKMVKEKAEIGGVSIMDIASEIVAQHYRGQVGLVPLTKTLHQMAHNGSIIIPLRNVNGEYKKFMAEYKDHIDEDMIKKINAIETYSDSEDSKEINKEKLRKKVLKYEIDYDSIIEE